jgi:hypothetical protein
MPGAAHFQALSWAAAFIQNALKGRWVVDFCKSVIAAHITINKLSGFRTDDTVTVRASIKTVLPWFSVLEWLVENGASPNEDEDEYINRVFALHAVASSPPPAASPASVDGLYMLENLLAPHAKSTFFAVLNSLRKTVDAATANKSGSAALRQLFAHGDYLRLVNKAASASPKLFVQYVIGTGFVALRTLLTDGQTSSLLKHFSDNVVFARTGSERAMIHECFKSLMHERDELEPIAAARAVPGSIVQDFLTGKVSNELSAYSPLVKTFNPAMYTESCLGMTGSNVAIFQSPLRSTIFSRFRVTLEPIVIHLGYSNFKEFGDIMSGLLVKVSSFPEVADLVAAVFAAGMTEAGNSALYSLAAVHSDAKFAASFTGRTFQDKLNDIREAFKMCMLYHSRPQVPQALAAFAYAPPPQPPLPAAAATGLRAYASPASGAKTRRGPSPPAGGDLSGRQRLNDGKAQH